MSLIQSEQDDKEVLRAEDEAILAADNPTVEAPPIPLGQDLADLIESLSHDETVSTEDRQG